MKEGFKIPKVTFRTRIGDEEETDGGCAIGGQWKNVTTDDYFKGKRVVLFSLPGAFTPICSTKMLPAYEDNYMEFRELGIDEVYCIAVNDCFVMEAWKEDLIIQNVKMLPDGNGDFTKGMGCLLYTSPSPRDATLSRMPSSA